MAKSKRCKKKSGFGKILKGLSSFGKGGRSKRLQTLFVSPIRSK